MLPESHRMIHRLSAAQGLFYPGVHDTSRKEGDAEKGIDPSPSRPEMPG